jgi:hypothetical protein
MASLDDSQDSDEEPNADSIVDCSFFQETGWSSPFTVIREIWTSELLPLRRCLVQ